MKLVQVLYRFHSQHQFFACNSLFLPFPKCMCAPVHEHVLRRWKHFTCRCFWMANTLHCMLHFARAMYEMLRFSCWSHSHNRKPFYFRRKVCISTNRAAIPTALRVAKKKLMQIMKNFILPCMRNTKTKIIQINCSLNNVSAVNFAMK